jgi:hypothetical protein
MNQAVTAPKNFQPALCPLLTAVLPLRYAIGPRDSIDASAYGLPALSGNFPSLIDPLAPQDFHPLGYTPRLLRDGWLYLWHPAHRRMAELQVDKALLSETERGGPVVDKRIKPYLILEAGAAAMLAWSPCQWSHEQFEAAKARDDVRQRVMRSFTPGAAPFGGQAEKIHEQIGDYLFAEGFKWSCEPDTNHRPDWPRTLDAMERCEQQSYVVIDDAWGVLMDLAGLLRARKDSFAQRRLERGEDWAIAGVIRSLSEGDDALRQQLPNATRYSDLKRTWSEQDQEEETHTADVRRLAEHWAEWFATLDQSTPASFDTACGHFDITQPDLRDALETHLALATLGPAGTGPGAKAVEKALDPEGSATGKPWLVWAVLGVAKRITGNEIKYLLLSADAVKQEQLLHEAGMALQHGKETVRALALSAALNHAADSLEALNPAKASDLLFTAVAPVTGGHLSSLSTQITEVTKLLMMASLTRSTQRLQVLELTSRQHLERLSELAGTRHNRSQRRRLKAELEQLEQAEARASRQAAGKPVPPVEGTLAGGVRKGIAHFELVPKPQPAPPHPHPGYGSDVPRSSIPKAPPAPASTPGLPPIRHLPDDFKWPSLDDLFEKAPLKSAIALVCAWNLRQSIWGEGGALDNPTGKNRVAVGGALLSQTAAVAAVIQQLGDVRWTEHVKTAGKLNPQAQGLLAEALKFGAGAWLAQSASAAIDTLHFGWEALDAFKDGDLDSATVYTGLSASNAALVKVTWRAMQLLRVARGLALAGNAATLSRGVAALPFPVIAQAAGLTLLILAGLITLFYTKDSPAEKWVKQTRFGTRPADWSRTYAESMVAFYQMLMPVSMELRRWREQNPYGGFANEIRLVLLLPGQQAYQQGMVSFDGFEEWSFSRGMLDFSDNSTRVPLVWGEDDPIPLYVETGSRVLPEPDGSLRLSYAYHESEGKKLKRISGTLIYQPIEGLYMPPLEIDLS